MPATSGDTCTRACEVGASVTEVVLACLTGAGAQAASSPRMAKTAGALNVESADDIGNFIDISPLILGDKAMASARACPVRHRRMKLYVTG